jgi:plasmid stability protein
VPDMYFACDMVECMGHIQIRNVPEDLHRTLKARAARKGMSLSEYMLAEARKIAAQPSIEEWVEQVRSRELIDVPEGAAEILRREREARGAR